MKKAVVTGANGFIGSALVKKLVENKIYVLAIDVSFSDNEIFNSDYVTKSEQNLFDIDSSFLDEYIGTYDTFYHLAWAGVNGTAKGDPLVQNTNIRTTLLCAQIAKKLGCQRFLCAGTVAELAVQSMGNLKSTSAGMMYGVAKHATHLLLEAYCKNVNLNFVWMQFSNIYGPNNKTGNLISYTISELKNNKEATFGPALQPYDFIYVDDLINAVYLLGAAEKTKDFYLIGSGTPRVLKEYLHIIGETFGRDDLIKIGVRADDGITYSFDMFDTSALVADIGEFVKSSFEANIEYTIDNF